jgi:hypothetical protein
MPGTAAAGSSGSRTEGLESMAGGGGGAQGVEVTVMWMSALPIKQAGVKKRYGSEAATSDEGKKILGQADPSYVLAIAGVPPQLLRGGDRAKDMMKEASMLAIKGKDPLKPIQVDVAGSLILLAFAKTNPIVPEDSEVEFVSKLGNSVLKCKFKLKDMQFDGRLAL